MMTIYVQGEMMWKTISKIVSKLICLTCARPGEGCTGGGQRNTCDLSRDPAAWWQSLGGADVTHTPSHGQSASMFLEYNSFRLPKRYDGWQRSEWRLSGMEQATA